jgi:hypothetical protein
MNSSRSRHTLFLVHSFDSDAVTLICVLLQDHVDTTRGPGSWRILRIFTRFLLKSELSPCDADDPLEEEPRRGHSTILTDSSFIALHAGFAQNHQVTTRRG